MAYLNMDTGTCAHLLDMLKYDSMKFPPFILKKMHDRADLMTRRVLPHLKGKRKVLDLGCGNCFISKNLIDKGYKVTSVDVKSQSLVPSIKSIVYNGEKLSFKDKSFDVVLLLTVLHHAPYPEKVLKEAARVTKRLIIIETSYRSLPEKVFIVVFDSMVNMQLVPHWGSYKSDQIWQKLFKQLQLAPVTIQKYTDMQGAPYFHPMYVLEEK